MTAAPPANADASAAPTRRRARLKKIVGGLGVLALAFAFGWVPYMLGGIATRRRFSLPDRENAGLTPASFQIPFEDVTFETPDRVSISGWWVPHAAARGTVIFVHGLNRTRIEMVKRIEPVHAWGLNGLLIDLRHHGASGGQATTFGWREKEDVRAAIDFALRRAPGLPVILWGVSLGGATVALATADDPRVSAAIVDSAYDSVPSTVRHHLRLFRGFAWYLKLIPQWPLADLSLFWIGQRGGFRPADVDIVAAASRFGDRPSLFVANRGDRRIPFEIAETLSRAAGVRSRVLIVESPSHGGAWRDGRAAYEPAVKGLIDETLAPPPRAAGAPSTTGEHRP